MIGIVVGSRVERDFVVNGQSGNVGMIEVLRTFFHVVRGGERPVGVLIGAATLSMKSERIAILELQHGSLSRTIGGAHLASGEEGQSIDNGLISSALEVDRNRHADQLPINLAPSAFILSSNPALFDPPSIIASISAIVLGLVVPQIFHPSSLPSTLIRCITTYSVRSPVFGPVPSALSRLCRDLILTIIWRSIFPFPNGRAAIRSDMTFVEWKGKIVSRGQ